MYIILGIYELENGNELIELMTLLQLSQNHDFTDIDDNLATECSSNNVEVILDNFHSTLNPMDVDEVQQN